MPYTVLCAACTHRSAGLKLFKQLHVTCSCDSWHVLQADSCTAKDVAAIRDAFNAEISNPAICLTQVCIPSNSYVMLCKVQHAMY